MNWFYSFVLIVLILAVPQARSSCASSESDGAYMLGTWTLESWQDPKHRVFEGVLVVDWQISPMEFKGAIHRNCREPCNSAVVELVDIKVDGLSVVVRATSAGASISNEPWLAGAWIPDVFRLEVHGDTLTGNGVVGVAGRKTWNVLIKQRGDATHTD